VGMPTAEEKRLKHNARVVNSHRFWHDLELADPLNQVIWDNSAAVQLEIGPPEQLRAVN